MSYLDFTILPNMTEKDLTYKSRMAPKKMNHESGKRGRRKPKGCHRRCPNNSETKYFAYQKQNSTKWNVQETPSWEEKGNEARI